MQVFSLYEKGNLLIPLYLKISFPFQFYFSVTASNASQWTGGYLFFDEELLPDIAKELERSYNVKIHIANDSLKTFRFYGNFVRREQNIQEVLEALASTEKMQYKIEERNITIY